MAKARKAKKASEKPRKMRGFGGDGKREEVTGLALSADGMKIYWSLAVNSLLFQRHMCHVDIMYPGRHFWTSLYQRNKYSGGGGVGLYFVVWNYWFVESYMYILYIVILCFFLHTI